MKSWMRGLLVAVLAIGVGLGTVSASPVFENRIDHVITSVDTTAHVGIEDSFVKGGRSGGSFSGGSRSGGSSFSSGSRSSGGFGSSSSRSSGGWGSKPSTPSSSSTTKSSGSWWGGGSKSSSSTSKPVAPANKTASSVDTKVNAATKSTGKTYSSKEAAVSSFKASAAKETGAGGKFTSQYKTEPSTRPAHIPATYNNHTVVYNSNMGGYGYWSGGGPGLGTWMMYDMLSDAAMLSAMSHHHGYYAPGAAPVYVSPHPVGYVLGWIFGIFFILVIVAIIYGAFKNNG